MLRISQWKGNDYDARNAETPSELAAWLEPLADAGVDIFDTSTRRSWLPEFPDSSLNLAGWAKKVTGKLAMTVGSVGLEAPFDPHLFAAQSPTAVSLTNLSKLVDMIEREEFDLVGAGRVLLANPNWPKLIREGAFDELATYDAARTAEMIEPAV